MRQSTPAAKGGRICISLARPDIAGILAALAAVRDPVDVVEIRLDAMPEADIAAICERVDFPLLFTNRPVWEGGGYEGLENERLQPLLAAVRSGAALIDLELKTSSSLRGQLLEQIKDSTSRLIISFHDFKRTPDAATLNEILMRQVNSGAHIGKIVTMAHDHIDMLNVLHLQSRAREHNFPLIAFCMGEAGKLSRVLTLLLGGYMSYAALDAQQVTAPGQMTVRQLRESLRLLTEISRPL